MEKSLITFGTAQKRLKAGFYSVLQEKRAGKCQGHVLLAKVHHGLASWAAAHLHHDQPVPQVVDSLVGDGSWKKTFRNSGKVPR